MPPIIYLMRHSQASPSDFRTSDGARWLTTKGRALARSAGLALKALTGDFTVDTIVTSPLARAVQSADIVAQCLAWNSAWESEICCLESLRSEGAPQRAIEDLQALGGAAVLAVCHEPIVSSMSALLIGQGVKDIRSGFHPAEIRGISDGEICWRWRD